MCDLTETQGEVIKFDLPHSNSYQIYDKNKSILIRNHINDIYDINNVTDKSLKLYFLNHKNIFFKYDLNSIGCGDITIFGVINSHNNVLRINIKTQSDELFKYEFNRLNPVVYFKYFHTKNVFNTYKIEFNFETNETLLLLDDSLTKW